MGLRPLVLLAALGLPATAFRLGQPRLRPAIHRRFMVDGIPETDLDDEDIPPMNTVTLVGRTGNEPQPTYFENGSVVVNLSLAVRREYTPLERKARDVKYGEEETDWFPLEIWGTNAEYARKYIRKGFRVGITGELIMDHWQDKETGEERERAKVFVRQIEILQSRSEGNGGGGGGGGEGDSPF